jgi:twitching motility protein PilT
MTPQQNIFKVLILHNKLATEDDLNLLMQQADDPEDIIAKMVIGEMISEAVGDKLLTLYQHNLHKQHLDGAGSMTAVAVPTAERTAVSSHNASTSSHAPLQGAATASSHAAPASSHPTPPTHRSPPPGSNPAHATPAKPPAVDRSAPIPASVRLDGDDRELIFDLLRVARQQNASDLHIKSGAVPVIRKATYLHELAVPVLPGERVERALKSLLGDADREQFERTNDLDCSFDGGGELGRFRLNLLRQHHGVDGTFRLIPDKVPHFDELHLPAECRRFTTFRQGIVLVTGPKGSGKTTTLAALIDLINIGRADHIITIEDPIEFVHPSKKAHVNQREVGVHTLSFANALRASLREAPDVIMVGEMRDLETVSLAITAAETGHLVFGTLHTPNAPRTINRVIDVFPPEEQGQIRAMFSESLRGVISQYLIPGRDGQSVHLATEIMFNSGAIANLVRENRAFQLHGMMQTHHKQGMHLMDESLLKLVKDGKISREEAIARADNVAAMERDTH